MRDYEAGSVLARVTPRGMGLLRVLKVCRRGIQVSREDGRTEFHDMPTDRPISMARFGWRLASPIESVGMV